MEVFWTEEINHCLNLAAPWKLGQKKQNKHSLSKEISEKIRKLKELHKKHKINVKNAIVDLELQKRLKKHQNYCNKLIKKAIREKHGKSITNENSQKQVWNCINDILKPENVNKN